MRTRAIWILLFTLLLGCDGGRPAGKLPSLYAAGGQVARADQLVAGGMVRFRLVAPPSLANNLIICGRIDDQGRFELSTTHALSQKKKSGAPVGVYAATYLPQSDNQDSPPIELSETFTVVEGPNEFLIELMSAP